jgi:hypothetical protein
MAEEPAPPGGATLPDIYTITSSGLDGYDGRERSETSRISMAD